MTIIIGIKIIDKIEISSAFQNIISLHACNIRTRIDFKSTCFNSCSNSKLIILELDNQKDAIALKKALYKVSGLVFNSMEI
jgi:hypothetical protein